MGAKEIFNPLAVLDVRVEVATGSAFQLIGRFAEDQRWGMQFADGRARVSVFVNEKGMWMLLPYRELCLAAGVTPQVTYAGTMPLLVDISSKAPFDKIVIDFGHDTDGLPLKALISYVDALFEVLIS